MRLRAHQTGWHWLEDSERNVMKIPNQILLMVLALGLSAWTIDAQNAGVMAQRGGRGMPRGGGAPGGSRGASGLAALISVNSADPVPKDDAEKKILDVLDEMNRTGTRGGMTVPRDDGRLLRILTESIGAKNVVELGTSRGYSGIWCCLALRATGGRLTSFETDTNSAALTRQNFTRAGVDSLVTLVVGDAHKEISRLKDPIDLVFIDAEKGGYLDYLNRLLPLVRSGGLIVSHNMDALEADPYFVNAITTDTNLETIFLTARDKGIGVTLKKR